jgi:hypothetical protein
MTGPETMPPSPAYREAQTRFHEAMGRARGPWRGRLRQACRAVQSYAPEIREWLAADDVDLRAMMGLGERPAQRRLL